METEEEKRRFRSSDSLETTFPRNDNIFVFCLAAAAAGPCEWGRGCGLGGVEPQRALLLPLPPQVKRMWLNKNSAAGRGEKTTAREQLHFVSVTLVNMFVFKTEFHL